MLKRELSWIPSTVAHVPAERPSTYFNSQGHWYLTDILLRLWTVETLVGRSPVLSSLVLELETDFQDSFAVHRYTNRFVMDLMQ